MFNCFRVYANGDRTKALSLTEAEKNGWVEYNQTFRFGCALFVNNECVYRGYLSEEEVKKVVGTL